jgi:hypothetical protein
MDDMVMKWEARKIKTGWGIFLVQKYCKTDEPVCYGIARLKRTIDEMVDRMNNPIYEEKI